MNFKSWLETTGLKVAEEQFLTAPALPYIVFSDEAQAGYSTLTQTKTDHSLTVALYSGAIDTVSEGLIEALIDTARPSITSRYRRRRTWVDNESIFVTIYEFTYEVID